MQEKKPLKVPRSIISREKDGQIEPDWQIELMGFYINMYFKICSMKLKHVKESTNYYMNKNDYDLKHAVDL